MVNSPPDGYTLLWHGLSSVVNASLFTNLPFDIQRDIDPAAGVVSYPMIMVAHPSVPAKSVAELIAHAKANPGKVTMASFGTGSASHLAGELFKFMAGIDMVHIPYRGGAPQVVCDAIRPLSPEPCRNFTGPQRFTGRRPRLPRKGGHPIAG